MAKIKFSERMKLKTYKQSLGSKQTAGYRTIAFSSFAKRKLAKDQINRVKSRQEENISEADFAYERTKEAELRAVAYSGKLAQKEGAKVGGKAFEKAQEYYRKRQHTKNVSASTGLQKRGRKVSLRKRKGRAKMAVAKNAMTKYLAIGAALTVLFICLFSSILGGMGSSIDMSMGQDNITSAYLCLGSMEAKKGKLTSSGMSIDAEPIMAYIISEFGLKPGFDDKQKLQLMKIYNYINAKGYRNKTNSFFNTYHKEVFSSEAKHKAYQKLISEGIYKQFKIFASPFVGKDWVSKVTSSWGWRGDPKNGSLKLHRGLDIGMPQGTPVNAICSGKVTSAGYNGGYGNCVMIYYENGDTKLTVLYGHLSSINVRKGQSAGEGAVIGKVGSTGRSTGPHLHIEIMSGAYSADVTKLYYPRIYMIEEKNEKLK